MPFFLSDGPRLGPLTARYSSPIDLPQDFTVVLLLPEAAVKASTAVVYPAFDGREGCAPATSDGRTRLRERS